MGALDTLRDAIPDAAKDIRLNLGAVLGESSLSEAQRWGVAYASAIAARNPALRDAIRAEAEAKNVPAGVLEDAKAAAALMAMNNVFYRFRHFMHDKPDYAQKPARLRMQRLAQPQSSKVEFELFSLAVSAINGCETCVQSHERVVVEGGLSVDHVHDAVRIAAVIHAAAVALEIA